MAKTNGKTQADKGNSLENVAANFLNLLRPKGPWQLTAIYPERTKLETQTFDKIDDARKWIAERNSKANLYYTPNTLKSSPHKKPEKVDVAAAEWLWVDLDYTLPKSGKMSPEYQKAERERIHELLTTKLPLGVPAPTAIVFTGGGFQSLWKLDKAVPIDGDRERWEEYERYNRGLCDAFGADHCWNVERILRLPGSTNIPDRKKKERGRLTCRAELVRFSPGAAYGLGRFRPAAANVVTPGITPGALGRDAPKIDPSTARGIKELDELDQWGVPGKCKMVIAQGDDPDEPGAYPSGSEAQWYVTCELVRCDVPDDIIYSIIADGTWLISAHVRRQKNPHNYALAQIAKAHEFAIHPKLAELNARYFVVGWDGGKCLVYRWWEENGRERLVSQSLSAFCENLESQKVEWRDDEGKLKKSEAGMWWRKHPNRRQYEGLIFDPAGPPVDAQGRLNIWRGFAVESRKGSWKRMLKHIYVVLAKRNRVSFKYIVRWIAWAVQNPDKPAGVAIVFRGPQGSGKGIVLSTVQNFFGHHGLLVDSPEQFAGRFNEHLRDCCLLFADEAMVPGDQVAVAKMKNLITGFTLPLEGKGKTIMNVKNHVKIVQASNGDWVAPVEEGDRRYAVFDTADALPEAERAAYFDPIGAELDAGGREAMLHDLRNMQLGDWRPNKDIPDTEAREEQKLGSRSPFHDPVEKVLGHIKDGRLKFIEAKGLLPSREPDQYERKHEQWLAKALRDMGWRRKQKAVDGVTSWCYVKGKEAPEYVAHRRYDAHKCVGVEMREKGGKSGETSPDTPTPKGTGNVVQGRFGGTTPF